MIFHDLRMAVRTLTRQPGLAIAAMLTLSLGVGAATSVFSVLYGVILKPLPYPQPENLLRLYNVAENGNRAPWSGANFVDLVEQSTAYDAVAGYQYMELSMRTDRFPVPVQAVSVTADFFRVLGVPAARGRTFRAAVDSGEGRHNIVLGHGFWQSRLGGGKVVGTSIELNHTSYDVVGVMPPGFEYPRAAEAWVASPFRVPMGGSSTEEDPATDRSSRFFSGVARLAPSHTVEEAAAEGGAIMARIAKENPETERGLGFEAVSLHEVETGQVRSLILVLFGAVALVLLIACANVANLLLARATRRVHEMAVRTSLGAGRQHIARQLLAENIFLGLMGGAGGVILTYSGTTALTNLAGLSLPRTSEIAVNLHVMVFAVLVSLASGLLFGLVPTFWLSRRNPSHALREGGGRGATESAFGRLRGALVAVEIAVSLALLVGAGLLMRTFSELSSTDPGFSARRVLTADVWLPDDGSMELPELRQVQQQIIDRVRSVPGVDAAGAVLSLPVGTGISAQSRFSVEGRPLEQGTEPGGGLQAASPGYFEAIGLPVLRGRTFTAGDGPDDPPVMIVSEAFAESFFPGEDPVGRRIGSGHPESDGFQWATIVGVVASTRYGGLDNEPRVEAYQPFAQAPWPFMTLVVKTGAEPSTLADPLRAAVMEVRPDQPVEHLHTMDEWIRDSLSRRKVSALLLGVFACLALALAAIGLYGVMSFSVARRTREIGIRMAVGAERNHILRLVLRDGGRLVGIGLAFGAASAAIVGWLIRGVLYGVPPIDLTAFTGAALALTVTAVLAVLLPAHRATRVNPAVSLRAE